MRIWIDANTPPPEEKYDDWAKNNEEAKAMIEQCEKQGDDEVRLINVDNNGLELMHWLLNRYTRYRIAAHDVEEEIDSQIQELYLEYWLLD